MFMGEFIIRDAREDDCEGIVSLIYELAVYEHLEKNFAATAENLRHSLFTERVARSAVAELQGELVGYAVYFRNFSTFLCRGGMYLEDLYVKQSRRKMGIGFALLSYVAKRAEELNCGRPEWCCLDWNKPSIEFYRSIGAQPLEDFTIYRLTGERITKLAEVFK